MKVLQSPSNGGVVGSVHGSVRGMVLQGRSVWSLSGRNSGRDEENGNEFWTFEGSRRVPTTDRGVVVKLRPCATREFKRTFLLTCLFQEPTTKLPVCVMSTTDGRVGEEVPKGRVYGVDRVDVVSVRGKLKESRIGVRLGRRKTTLRSRGGPKYRWW